MSAWSFSGLIRLDSSLLSVMTAEPLIFPVNYVLEGRTVAFRTDPGTKLTWAKLGHVAFEIDSTDPSHREGWSVLVQGIGTEITDALDASSERILTRSIAPMAGGAKSTGLPSPRRYSRGDASSTGLGGSAAHRFTHYGKSRRAVELPEAEGSCAHVVALCWEKRPIPSPPRDA